MATIKNEGGEVHPIAIATLSRAFTEKMVKEADGAIEEGASAAVSLTARIEGRLTRGAATEANPTASLLNEAVLAETVRRLGVTRDHFEKTLREVATDALVAKIPIKDHLVEKAPELLAVMHTIKRDVIAQLPKQHRPGAIKVIASTDFRHVVIG